MKSNVYDFTKMEKGSRDSISGREIEICPLCGRRGIAYKYPPCIFLIHVRVVGVGAVSVAQDVDYCHRTPAGDFCSDRPKDQ